MEIIKNYLKYSLWFVLIVFAVLLGLHWLPALTIDGHTMRRVDLLSDLRYPESETAAADSDSIPLPPVVKPAFVDTCRTGMTCIEDYSDSTLRGMTPFYKALDRVSSDDSDDKQVRIAVFGDSFIEADIFTADLRENASETIRRLWCRFCYHHFLLEFDHDHTRKQQSHYSIKWKKVSSKKTNPIYQYMLQLREMGENPEEYNSIWNYTEGETEPRFPLYNYPDAGSR